MNFLQSLYDSSESSHFLIIGDVNDLRHHMSDFFIYNNLVQIVNQPTRGDNILDVIVTNHPFLFEPPLCISPLNRSDHKGIFVKSVSDPRKNNITTKVVIRSCSPSSYASCRAVLGSQQWKDFINIDDIDEMVWLFHMFVNYCYETFYTQNPPWLSPSLKALSNARDRALSKGNRSKFLSLRERFITELSKAKKNFFSKLTSSSNTWKIINSQRQKSKHNSLADDGTAHELNDI